MSQSVLGRVGEVALQSVLGGAGEVASLDVLGGAGEASPGVLAQQVPAQGQVLWKQEPQRGR